jgi:serine/threonine protein kinase
LLLLKHDNIVKLLDFGVLDDGQLFMCFEYIEGKSLDRYVAERGGRLDIRNQTCGRIAAALSRCMFASAAASSSGTVKIPKASRSAPST